MASGSRQKPNSSPNIPPLTPTTVRVIGLPHLETLALEDAIERQLRQEGFPMSEGYPVKTIRPPTAEEKALFAKLRGGVSSQLRALFPGPEVPAERLVADEHIGFVVRDEPFQPGRHLQNATYINGWTALGKIYLVDHPGNDNLAEIAIHEMWHGVTTNRYRARREPSGYWSVSSFGVGYQFGSKRQMFFSGLEEALTEMTAWRMLAEIQLRFPDEPRLRRKSGVYAEDLIVLDSLISQLAERERLSELKVLQDLQRGQVLSDFGPLLARRVSDPGMLKALAGWKASSPERILDVCDALGLPRASERISQYRSGEAVSLAKTLGGDAWVQLKTPSAQMLR